MLRLIYPISSILFAIFFIFLSKNKRNYQKLVENAGEKFAAQTSRYLNIGGYFLLVFSTLWLLFSLIFFP
jgi:isoprenylcysteine carboxyl methyltransferase (ICMT) family protein YpbQ